MRNGPKGKTGNLYKQITECEKAQHQSRKTILMNFHIKNIEYYISNRNSRPNITHANKIAKENIPVSDSS